MKLFPAAETRLRVVLMAVLGLGSAHLLHAGDEPPGEVVAGLSAEAYPERVKAEARFEEWLRGAGELGERWVIRRIDQTEDPEARERMLSVLQKVVLDRLAGERPGFLGISMGEVRIPGDGKFGTGIQISAVIPGSPAEQAGLSVRDVVVALNGKHWEKAGAPDDFARRVGEMKPGAVIRLDLVEKGVGEPKQIEVTLAARPWSAGTYGDESTFGRDLMVAEKEARDAVFRDWWARRSLPPESH